MWPDLVSNPGPLTYESGALPTALRSSARTRRIGVVTDSPVATTGRNEAILTSIRRNTAASTSVQRHFDVMCPLATMYV